MKKLIVPNSQAIHTGYYTFTHTTGWEVLGGLRGGEWHLPIYLLERPLWPLCGDQLVGDRVWKQGSQLGVGCNSPGSVVLRAGER